ncbi:nitrate reductase molybdenum cofactor assembly chaperone [Pelomonas sp. UHG3]|jgi:nitrate reductase delta subunit|uniref:Nitrate reductase molybdenum cofactor assembly chaperone n=1 Tax=Roseateles hydrophilus TaxID=2975054 RepID=A0ACC6C4N1_9BURK|nr:nitrate reductase molybdenum cofactor assembly chaperone [Pelomonas sp. UHG3]MCY4743362.1 nitrate reductase molybdenum cofactor assembly chaperone [Pelomonas sp. UHG3]
MFKITPSPYTLRVLAALLRYPDAAFRAAIPELQQALSDEAALPKARLDELQALLTRLQRDDPFTVESEFVDLFDRGRGTALHLFEHVHGDSRERGPAMIDLQQTYEKAGLYLTASELPDHLAVVLEFASTQPPREAKAFLGEIAHIVRAIFSALLRRQSAYASALAAVLELAGERAESVEIPPEPELDEAWAEPEAFGGCSTAGQAKPDQPQPIHIVRKTAATQPGARV